MVRFVQLHTWYVSADGKRQFCVVDKTGKHISEPCAGGTKNVYQTTSVKLLEVLKPNPINYDMVQFWKLVDAGKLIEFIPGVTDLGAIQEAFITQQSQPAPTLFEAA